MLVPLRCVSLAFVSPFRFCDEIRDGRSYLDEASVNKGAGCKGVYRVVGGKVSLMTAVILIHIP